MLAEEGCTGPINLGHNSEFTILELAERALPRRNPNCMLDCICKVRGKDRHAVIVTGNKISN
jgi:hypothetical protein